MADPTRVSTPWGKPLRLAVLISVCLTVIVIVALFVAAAVASRRPKTDVKRQGKDGFSLALVLGMAALSSLFLALCLKLLVLYWPSQTCREYLGEKATSSSAGVTLFSPLNPNVNANECGSEGVACDITRGQVCVSGTCVCSYSGTTYCPTIGCVDLLHSDTSCGTCGNACTDGFTCNNGTCVCIGDAVCGGSCVDLYTNSSHCGDCGSACPPGQSCVNARCAVTAPPVDTNTDPLNCGTRNNLCTGSSAQCCDGVCSDRTSDLNHCGDCFTDCEQMPGMATATSPACCYGHCTDRDIDPSNCGECGLACPVGMVCVGGECFALGTNANCSSAGDACGSSATCINGTCVAITDDRNCGTSNQNCLETFGPNGHCVCTRYGSTGVCVQKSCVDGENDMRYCESRILGTQNLFVSYYRPDGVNPNTLVSACMSPAAYEYAMTQCQSLGLASDPLSKTGLPCTGVSFSLSALAGIGYILGLPPQNGCPDYTRANAGGALCCDGKVVDPTTNSFHCGSCTNDCSLTGFVSPICREGICVDRETNNKYCGMLEVACAPNQLCVDGNCTSQSSNNTNASCYSESEGKVITCAGGTLQGCCAGECRFYSLDPLACGGCGPQYRCAFGNVCRNGVCLDLRNNPGNCGGNGPCFFEETIYGAASVCVGNSCEYIHTDTNCAFYGDDCTTSMPGGICVPNTLVSGGWECASSLFDSKHCGGSAGNFVNCGAGNQCINGTCVGATTAACGPSGAPCPSGSNWKCCAGGCTNTNIDPNHCGSCGSVCLNEKVCTGGVCV